MSIPKSSELIQAELTPELVELVDKHIPVKSFPKGTILLREGEVPKESYFIISGLVRAYIITDEGNERTVDFFAEGDACSVTSGYENQNESVKYLECIEESVMSAVTPEDWHLLTEKWPEFETLCRMEIEKNLSNANDKMMKFLTSSPEKRYADLMQERPELAQRVPQYHLASYLGIKPESLSRIRKRLVLQEKEA